MVEQLITDIKQEGFLLPDKFQLEHNYPNPFNPTTKINFSISNAGQYSLKDFNVLGQEVKTLLDNYLQPGSYDINFNGKELSSGIYIYRFVGDSKVLSKKMILLKLYPSILNKYVNDLLFY